MISANARQFCREKVSEIENYDKAIADYQRTWHCHHRRETPVEGIGLSREELKKNNLYYDRPAKELIFLTPEEHLELHHSYIQSRKQNAKKECNYQINGVVSFADFLNAKNRIVKKYAIWIFRHPENRKELERKRDREITDLLDEYEQREKTSFQNMAKLKELGIRIDVKLLSKK